MPQEETAGNAAETAGNAAETAGNALVIPETELTDSRLLAYIAGQVEDLIELVRDRCDALDKRIGHLDGLAHQVDQRVGQIHADLEKYRPLLERYADPGKAVRDMFDRAVKKQKGSRT